MSDCAGASVAAYVVEDDQRTIHAANGIVPYPWLDGHHAGVEASHVGDDDERFVGGGCRSGQSVRRAQ